MSGHHIRAGLATMTRAAEPAPRDEEPGQQVKWPVGNRISRAVPLMVAAVVAALAAAASGYGYHRDELYFLAAGRHLAWAYPDQGPLTPVIARLMSTLAPQSLTVLRLPSAAAAGATVLLTALLARELGGGRGAQWIAAACAGTAVIVLFTGHTLSTTTFDLLTWTAITWLAIRAIRTGADRLWLVAGVVLGVGLLNKPLPAFLAGGLLVGIAVAGPRKVLRNRYLWAGALIAAALWSPWLAWQAAHGWPQLAVSRAIAAGGSVSSQPWWEVVPFQPLLAGPVLAPVWIAGLIRLFRDPSLRGVRFLGWTWLALAGLFMAVGGKPYYLAGLLPALIGAGATPAEQWLARGRQRARRAVLLVVIAVSALAGAIISLPVLPARDAGLVVALNPDVGETIGWPQLAGTVAAVYHQLPGQPHAVILTQNYGEAGAIDRYGPALGLPSAYSGHNAFGEWGPPPNGSSPVVAIGFDQGYLTSRMRGCTVAARIHNFAGISNQEQGKLVFICQGPRLPWSREWPALLHLG